MVYDGLATEYKTITNVSGAQLNYTSGTIAATTLTAATITTGTITTGTITQNRLTTGIGEVIQLPVDANVSGGMFVVCTSGTAATCSPAGASDLLPLGIALATTASGGTVDILVKGRYSVLANGNVVANTKVAVGGGAALNGVVAAGSATYTPDATCGIALNNAASGTANTVEILFGTY